MKIVIMGLKVAFLRVEVAILKTVTFIIERREVPQDD